MRNFVPAALLLAVACRPADRAHEADSNFARVQSRGESVMGVDQYTSKHVFEDLPDGGRVVLDRDDASDTAAIRAIRRHMRAIEAAFRRPAVPYRVMPTSVITLASQLY